MAVPDSAILSKLGAAMAAAAPDGWQRITLTVSAVSSTMDTKLAIELADGSTDRSRGIDVDAQMLCDDLRESMYTEGSGTWYNATIELTPPGKIEAGFDYDNPPFGGDFSADMLEDDQEAFPRDAEHLPAWHPAHQAR